MRTTIRAAALVLALAAIIAVAAGQSWADATAPTGKISIHGGDLSFVQVGDYLIPQGEVRKSDLYLWAQHASIEGTLDGDLIAWVQSGEIDGAVTQDVALFAQSLHINGEVGDDVRAFCQNLYIDGRVKGDVLAMAANIVVGEKGRIDGDLMAAGGVVTISGDVGGDARVVGGTVTLNGSIGGNAELLTDGGLTLGPGASVGGDLQYRSPGEIEFQKGVVKGTVTFKPGKPKGEGGLKLPHAFGILFHIFSFIAALIAGSVIIALTKDHARRTAETIRRKPMKSLGIGFLAFICVPVIVIIALILIVTIPLSAILLLGYLIALYIARFYVSIWIGNLILRRSGRTDKSPVPAMLLGLVIIYLVTAIPVAGFILSLLIVFLGLGALLQRRETGLNGVFEPAPVPSNGLPSTFPGARAPQAPPAPGV
jgi:cytoskeletal protein CcmA (bactofilin family)